MTDTREDLQEAFAGESQAFRKYQMFAQKADADGYPNVAKLFRTAAEAERIHAEAHFKALDGVGTTADNLKDAIAGETHEYAEMYPPMLARAEAAGHKAKRMFAYAVKAEEIHARCYKLALDAVQSGADLSEAKFYLCPICGHIEFGNPPEACPICGAPASKYIEVA